MKVRDIMTEAVVSARPETRLKDLARLLSAQRLSGVPVVDDDGAIIGVVSEGDLVAKHLGHPAGQRTPISWVFGERPDAGELRRRAATTVGQAMTAPAITIDADRPIREAAALMVDRQVNRLPVTDGGRLAGIVTRADLVRAYLRQDDDILRTVRHEVIAQTMWLDPDALDVEVREGIVRLAGMVDRRSTATILEKLVGLVEGVYAVDSYLTWQVDDRTIEPAEPGEREPGAASVMAREHSRPMHG